MTGVVVVGGSVGGVRTVRWLRKYGYGGAITLVEREPELPHDKPPLSKAALVDDNAPPPTLLDRTEAAALDVELLLGNPAVRFDPVAAVVHVDGRDPLGYDDAAVIATGARARETAWTAIPQVHLLRSWQQARRLRSELRPGRRVVVIGAGFIGAEVASSARRRDCQVELVDAAPLPMARHVGADVAALFEQLHARHGVTTHFGVQVAGVSAVDGGVQVRLGTGKSLQADLVVAGLGVELNTEWLQGSGLRLGDGIVADSRCRALDTQNVYVVGDAARWQHTGYGEYVRSEHWTNAVDQAEVVAHNIIHPDDQRDHAPVPYLWSDQYDWKIQIAGRPDPGRTPLMLRVDDSKVVALWDDDRAQLRGVATVNSPRDAIRGRQLLAAGSTAAEALTAFGGWATRQFVGPDL